MVLDQDTRGVDGIDITRRDAVDDDNTSMVFVICHLVGCHIGSTRNIIVEIVGMGSTDIGNVASCLCPSGGIGRVGMDYTILSLDFGKK